ncbi:MAG: sn-glycerol-1-phosphate dehydrogenase [Thaumarchaeota archaeon]|nr:sn-glycerol-1-phosphate dehydrogenase [Nitrososphaerota archaeon]
MQFHAMELPRLIVIGEKIINNLEKFLHSISNTKKISIISGKYVKNMIQEEVMKILSHSNIQCRWHIATNNNFESINILQKKISLDKSKMIIGIGGGRSVDIAKMISFKLSKQFISMPTSASHDGIASPFVSISGNRPYSIIANAPLGVFVDIDIIKRAPKRLLASGCGDLIANIIAIHDWKLGRDKNGEYFGEYAANLSYMSSKILMENTKNFAKNGFNVRIIVEALISAGVASCIAGSSRPCSGSEHLFSHALDMIAPGIGLHGEKCGLGSIMMAKLQGQNWKKIAQALIEVGAPTTAKQIGIKPKTLVKALTIAQGLRPERYTILKEFDMNEKKASKLAKSTLVI